MTKIYNLLRVIVSKVLHLIMKRSLISIVPAKLVACGIPDSKVLGLIPTTGKVICRLCKDH